MKRCFLILVLLLASISTFAQNVKQDVVYLKNGSIIRGEIVNLVPNEAVKIKTADGSVFAYAMDEVKEITKEPAVKPEKRNRTNEKRKGYIGLSLGPSFPLGDFSKGTYGKAGNGAQVSLVNFGYLFSDHIGICAAWIGGAYPIKDDSSISWGYGGLMAGPLFSTSIAKKIDLDFRPMIGFSSVSSPYSNLNTASTYSFAYDIGALLRFNVGRRIALLVNVDYFSTNPEFQDYNVKQNVSVFNIGGGIAYRLR